MQQYEKPTSAAVSFLFVPGNRPDRFQKALDSGASRVILDLEDSIPDSDKAQAQTNVTAALHRGLSAPVFIRINGVGSTWLDADLGAIHDAGTARPGCIAGVVIPKLESVAAVDRIRSVVRADLELIGLVESAVGVRELGELARSGVSRLGVGAIDLSVDLGAEVNSPLLQSVYTDVVIGSRACGIDAPLGSPPLTLDDPAGIEAEARRLSAMGIGGQLCIHPKQVPPIHRGFAPTQEQIAWARRVQASIGGAVQVDGQMVDLPVRNRAARIIELSEAQ